MLEMLRKNVSGILAKILIGLLVLSFAVWGIGDMVVGYGRDTVASVGGNPIKANDFHRAYQLQISQFNRQFRRHFTPQQAKALGIEKQVLDRLTQSMAVDNHVKELQLDLSDNAIRDGIMKDPLFQLADGTFNQQRFQSLLYQSGYSEDRFFAERRRDTLREHLTGSMLANVKPPKTMVDMIRAFQGEKRIAQYIEVKAASAVKLGEPTEADLKKTYEGNKRRFILPEYRKFQVLMLTADAAKAKLEISDSDLKTSYEANKANYTVPEKRRIQQIAFKDEAAASAALAEIKSGKTFIEVAKASGAKETDIDLGLKTKDGLIDKTISEAAFKLAKDKVSDVVKGRLTTVLLRVTEVKEGELRPFDEVKSEIRQEIETERVAEKIQELQNNIDDNRLAGKTLKEIGTILDLPFLDIAEADQQGNKPDKKPAITSPDSASLIRTAFAAEVGVENEVIELSNDGFAWLNLIAVVPEKQRPFDDAKSDVLAAWKEIETSKKLSELSTNLAKKINSGTTMEAAAKEIAAKVTTTPAFKRRDSVPNLTQATVSRVFALPLRQATDAAGPNKESRLVIRVTKVEPAEEPKPDAAKPIEQELVRQLQSDALNQYVAQLEKRMGVTINTDVVDLTTGATVAEHPYQR